MKKIFLLLLATTLLTSIFAQVDKENVLLEIGTGTWCYYCPGAAMGADDMIANGHDVAVVENHNGNDPFVNDFSNARNSYYGITGYPTAWVDGVYSHVGGNHTNSLYATYLQSYNQRINVPSDFDIDFVFTSYEDDYSVHFDIEKVNGNYGDVRFHFVITESEIQYSWQGMSEVNFVNRLMLPGSGGTTLNFSSQDSHDVNINFSIDPSWVGEHCEMVAFLQNHQTKEVYQVVKMSVSEMVSNNDYDLTIKEVYVPRTLCADMISPFITLMNFGQETINNCNISYSINGGDEESFDWEGSLGYGASEFVYLPQLELELQENNVLNIAVSEPNGQSDEFPYNNLTENNIEISASANSPITVQLKLDANPEETSWEVLNSSGEIMYAGDNYTTPNTEITESFDLDYNDCYSFILYDEGGDGLTLNGAYNFMIYDPSFSFFEQVDDFTGYQDEIQFYIGLVNEDENISFHEINVFPNPFSQQLNINFQLSEQGFVNAILVNTLGEIVFTQQQNYTSGNHSLSIDSQNLSEGLYYLKMEMNGDFFQQEVLLVK